MSNTPYTPEQSRAIAAKAIDWLEAHPERHIAGKLFDVDRMAEATCFCVTGRMVYDIQPPAAMIKEAFEEEYQEEWVPDPTEHGGYYSFLDKFVLAPLGLNVQQLYGVNDSCFQDTGRRRHPNPNVYNALRRRLGIPERNPV